jgi:hypothetical protein
VADPIRNPRLSAGACVNQCGIIRQDDGGCEARLAGRARSSGCCDAIEATRVERVSRIDRLVASAKARHQSPSHSSV